MKNKLQKVINTIKTNDSGLVTILIDGRGGSGKTTIAKSIANNLKDYLHINLDEYTVEQTDLFVPENIKSGFDVKFKDTKYDEDRILEIIRKSGKRFVIIEGCFSFKNISLIKPNYKLWVEVDKEIALTRLNDRELNDPSRKGLKIEIIKLANQKWQESEDEYVEEFNPRKKADFVIEN